MLKNKNTKGQNTVDPDVTAHNKPSHLNLQCLQIQLLLSLALYGFSSYIRTKQTCAVCTDYFCSLKHFCTQIVSINCQNFNSYQLKAFESKTNEFESPHY